MSEVKDWSDEAHHALSVYEKVLGIIGVWPLNAGDLKSIVRCVLAILIQVSCVRMLENLIIYKVNQVNIVIYEIKEIQFVKLKK